jgi:hypothetical protein
VIPIFLTKLKKIDLKSGMIISAIVFIFAAAFFLHLWISKGAREIQGTDEPYINVSVNTFPYISPHIYIPPEIIPPRERLADIENYILVKEIQGVNYLFLPYWAQEAETEGVVTLRGSQIPTIFITTESGCLAYIHEDMTHREGVEFIFVDEQGYVEHRGSGDMNGRGNQTWQQPKRPYNFRLEAGVYLPLFGLGEGRHWTLLANYMDDLRVRNIVALNLARELGISHTPQIRPVDIFINGEYMGVYDLVERRSINHSVHISDLQAETQAMNRESLSQLPRAGVHEPTPGTFKYIEIPNNPADISGGYLLEIQLPRRYMLAHSGFVTERGAVVNLNAPEFASRSQVGYIHGFFQQMEDAVYSETGYNTLGRHFGEYICIRSFAVKYIFQEFIMDVDTANTSFFMYKEKDTLGSGRLYPGPAWDMDFSLGTLMNFFDTDMHDPTVWWANAGYIDFNRENYPHLLNALYRHEIFREYVVDLWQSEIAPVIRVLVAFEQNDAINLRTIDCYINEIAASRSMERIIWPLQPNRSFSNQAFFSVSHFARARYVFLNGEWGGENGS